MILALRALPPSGRSRLMRAVTRLRPVTSPFLSVPVFYVVVIGTHVPGFYDATLTYPLLHDLEHVLYLASGLLLFWPLLDGDPVPAHRIGGLGRLLYLLAAMPAMAVVGAYLNRHTPPLYTVYAAQEHALGVGPMTDQAQAGAIMWVGGDFYMAVVGIWVALSAMVAAERRQQSVERARARSMGAVDRAGARSIGSSAAPNFRADVAPGSGSPSFRGMDPGASS